MFPKKLASIQRSIGMLLWCALVAAFVFTSLGERRIDFWWQLREGTAILATHHLPTQPAAAFGLPSSPYIDEYALYEIVLAALYALGGFTATHAAFIAVNLLIVFIPLLSARGPRRDLLSAALLALACLFLINRYEQRPELVGVLLLVVLIALLRRAREFTGGLVLQLALLFAVWTNVHSSYVIGLVALEIWLIDRVLFAEAAGRWKLAQAVVLSAVAAGALLVNPYGSERIAFTFTEEFDSGSNLLSREMWPTWDQPADVIALLSATALVLAAVFLRSPRPARWLMMLATFLFFLALFHFRHISFLAAGLLFIYADRPATEPSPRWAPLMLPVGGTACIFALLFDVFAARTSFGYLASTEDQRNRGFAPGLMDSSTHGAILCHDAEGAFLSRPRGFFPLLDSGQGHFDDATKRFYFFTVQDPVAFNLALDRLPQVDEVVMTPPVEGWTLALVQRPDWVFIRGEPCGLLFRRSPSLASHDLTSKQREEITGLRNGAMAEGDTVRAFCFSTLIDPPAESLALLDRSAVSAWSEPFYRFARAWAAKFSASEINDFRQFIPHPANGLVNEITCEWVPHRGRLRPSGPTALERLARVQTLLDFKEDADARALFATVRRPLVSPLYYELRAQLEPGVAQKAGGSERWQTWDDDGPQLFDQIAPSLNARAVDRIGEPTLGGDR